MSLSSTIQVAANSPLAQQIGLKVVGNNIANAATEGYPRQRVDFVPAPTQERGAPRFGLGVRIQGITSQINRFVQDRARRAASDLAAAEPQEKAYIALEGILGEFGDTDLSSHLDRFFAGLNDILAEPENIGVRSLAIAKGEAVANELNRLDQHIRRQHGDNNNEIIGITSEINNLFTEIAELNLQIVTLEGGGLVASDAVGLRDQRELALSQLAEIVDIQAIEDTTGSTSVFAGGDFLVLEGRHRDVKTVFTQQDGLTEAHVHIVQTDSELQFSSGKLAGLTAARDEVLKGFLQEVDEFAQTFIFEFNQLHSSGLGLAGNSELTTEFAVDDLDAALDEAGLLFTPQNGSFQVKEPTHESTADGHFGLPGRQAGRHGRDLVPRTE